MEDKKEHRCQSCIYFEEYCIKRRGAIYVTGKGFCSHKDAYEVNGRCCVLAEMGKDCSLFKEE